MSVPTSGPAPLPVRLHCQDGGSPPKSCLHKGPARKRPAQGGEPEWTQAVGPGRLRETWLKQVSRECRAEHGHVLLSG